MTDDVATRRGRLERERFELGYRHGAPTAHAIERKNARLAEIAAELAALPAPAEEKTGMNSNQRLVLAHTLGVVTPEPEVVDYASNHHSSTNPLHGGDSPWDEI